MIVNLKAVWSMLCISDRQLGLHHEFVASLDFTQTKLQTNKDTPYLAMEKQKGWENADTLVLEDLITDFIVKHLDIWALGSSGLGFPQPRPELLNSSSPKTFCCGVREYHHWTRKVSIEKEQQGASFWPSHLMRVRKRQRCLMPKSKGL